MTLDPPKGNLDTSKTYKAKINTEKGEIIIHLYSDQTPITCENFINLAKNGYYNGTTFHRVIPGFMLQGGDPTEMIQSTAEVQAMMPTEQVANIQDNPLLDVLLNETPWGAMILVFLFFFIGGYLLYGSLMAAIGAAVELPEPPCSITTVIAYLGFLYGAKAVKSA